MQLRLNNYFSIFGILLFSNTLLKAQICGFDEKIYSGKATYYINQPDALTKNKINRCQQDHADFNPFYIAAIDDTDFNSGLCGACAEVSYTNALNVVKKVNLTVINECGSDDLNCKSGHIDMSREAFAQLENPTKSVLDVTYKYVPCQNTGNVKFRAHQDINKSWMAIVVRNHLNLI